ncbi:MAG: PilZ domain-containing protein [Desulfuromonadales bacterium]|nr:PilZ domain-containing protein [Desulfuromonadales bacterium]
MAHHDNDPAAGTQLSKRRDLRTPLIVQKVKIESDQKVFFGYSKNISKSGMFIASVNPLEPGTQVEVEIPLPSDPQKSIRCRCEVIWKRLFAKKSIYEPGMGLKFLDLSEEMATELDSWVCRDS